jgi:hypothetical protein
MIRGDLAWPANDPQWQPATQAGPPSPQSAQPAAVSDWPPPRAPRPRGRCYRPPAGLARRFVEGDLGYDSLGHFAQPSGGEVTGSWCSSCHSTESPGPGARASPTHTQGTRSGDFSPVPVSSRLACRATHSNTSSGRIRAKRCLHRLVKDSAVRMLAAGGACDRL